MVIAKIKECIIKIKTFIVELWNFKKVHKGLQDVINSQNDRIRKLADDRTIIYNLATERVLGPMYKLEVYTGANKFWSGRKGIKTQRVVDAYRKNQDLVEIPITFEGSGDVYYWYFLKLDEEE